jgi:outer membrane protein OmpA-like peptidoglycan-associated protein
MLSSVSGGQTRDAGRRVQAGFAAESGTSGLRCRHLAPLFAALLAGCASFPSSMNPVSWWHDLEGGKIAEERPPPPGADQPYPNLATVPPKPAEPDRAALTNIVNALIADRANAQHVAAAAPITDPSLPSASPALFGRGTMAPPPPAPPPGTAKASATMAAAEPAPGASTPSQTGTGAGSETVPAPAKAPVATVQSAPLAPPGATAQPPAADAGTPPPLPTTPPPPPNLPGVAAAAPPPPTATPPTPAPAPASPPVATAPAATPPPSAPATAAEASPAPTPPAGAANTVNVTFVTGSAELQASATTTLKQLAARRGNGIIAVTGYGDATSNDPNAQSAALTLGLSRAQAMAGALTAAGVPASAVQVDAAAVGRGGTARLVQ